MQKLALLLLLVPTLLSAQSVTISQSKLDELTAILQDYVKITMTLQSSVSDLTSTVSKLQPLFQDSNKRISDLQTGFDQYRADTDALLIKYDRQSWALWIVGGGSLGLAVGSLTGKPIDEGLGALGGMALGAVGKLVRDLVK